MTFIRSVLFKALFHLDTKNIGLGNYWNLIVHFLQGPLINEAAVEKVHFAFNFTSFLSGVAPNLFIYFYTI